MYQSPIIKPVIITSDLKPLNLYEIKKDIVPLYLSSRSEGYIPILSEFSSQLFDKQLSYSGKSIEDIFLIDGEYIGVWQGNEVTIKYPLIEDCYKKFKINNSAIFPPIREVKIIVRNKVAKVFETKD